MSELRLGIRNKPQKHCIVSILLIILNKVENIYIKNGFVVNTRETDIL